MEVSGRNASLTRIKRAVQVREILIRLIHQSGDWSERPADDRASRRLYGTFKGAGWYAMLSVEVPEDPVGEAAIGPTDGGVVLYEGDENLDLWVDEACKVLSMSLTADDLKLVSMVPGPWEAAFGLAARPWPPHVERRLARSFGTFLRAA